MAFQSDPRRLRRSTRSVAFWGTHDFTDYDTDAPDVAVTFRRTIAIELF
jgi:hypothetical protein